MLLQLFSQSNSAAVAMKMHLTRAQTRCCSISCCGGGRHGHWNLLRLTGSQIAAVQEFGEYYLSKHGGRKLAWQSTSSNCLVRAHFASGVKELQASLHQVWRRHVGSAFSHR